MQTMEVWKRTFVLVAALVTMAMVSSADSAVIDLKQLFKATDRARRPATRREVQYPETNPCLDSRRTAFRFEYPGRTDMFIQCEMGDAMSLNSCPEEVPYFDPERQTCTPEPTVASALSHCGLTTNPCTDEVLFFFDTFTCPANPHQYLMCDSSRRDVVTLKTCPLNEVFNEGSQSCIETTTHHSGSRTEAFSPPCTQEAIQSGQLYHPYDLDPHKYIQCDLWGAAHVRTCELDFYFNPVTNRCVSSLVGRK